MITPLLAHIPKNDNATGVGGELWYLILSVELPKLLVARKHFDGPQFDLLALLQLVIKIIQELLVNDLVLKSRVEPLKLDEITRSDCFYFGCWGWCK